MCMPTQHVPHQACPSSVCYYSSNHEQELLCPIINSYVATISVTYVRGSNTSDN